MILIYITLFIITMCKMIYSLFIHDLFLFDYGA